MKTKEKEKKILSKKEKPSSLKKILSSYFDKKFFEKDKKNITKNIKKEMKDVKLSFKSLMEVHNTLTNVYKNFFIKKDKK